MQRISLKLLTLVSACLLACAPARSQEPSPRPAVSPDQARQALDLLQNDAKRDQLIQTLQTVAKAAPQPSTPAADNLGAQLLAQVSNWFGEVSGQLAAAARTMSVSSCRYRT